MIEIKVIKIAAVLCSCIVIVLFGCLPVSAYSDYDPWSYDSMIERGYIFDGECFLLPSGAYDPIMYSPSVLVAPEPNYPDFDPNKIPWSSAPQAVQDIINMSLTGASSSDPATYKMPFVLVRVTASSVSVYAGLNCGLGFDVINDRMRVCCTYYFYDNSFCYRANFSPSDYSVTTDWTKLSQTVWGEEGYSNVHSYSSTLAYSTSNYDFYFYGGNGVRVGSFTSISLPLVSSPSSRCFITIDNQVGFQSGRFFYLDTDSSTIYCQYFTPKLFSDLNDSVLDDYKGAEEVLLSGYDINNFANDFKVTLDDNSTSFIFNLLTATVFSNSYVSMAVLSILCLGIVALLFNR